MNQTPDGVPGAINRAADHLWAHGGPFELARLSVLLPDAARNTGHAHIPVAPDTPQNSDGGWPAPWSEGVSSFDATCFLLDQIADFTAAPPAVDLASALGFLTAGQLDDGTWREASSVSTPERLTPGSAAARVYLTANCARALVVHQGPQGAIERGAQALEWSLDPHGRLPGPLEAHWLAARVFRATGRDLAARRLLDVVGRHFDELDAGQLAWFGSNTPRGDRWTHRIAARLAALQQPDGSWLDADGKPSARLGVTACRVLLRA